MKKILLLACLAFSLNTFAQIPNYVPTNGLVGYWPFTGNANDESVNGNNGTVNGATLTTDRFAQSNKAYSFNSGNNISLPTSVAWANVTGVTFSAWAKFNSIASGNGGNTVLDLSDGSCDNCWSNRFSIIQDNNSISFGREGSVLGGFTLSSSTTPQSGIWIHIVGTIDSTTHIAKLYLNGTLFASGASNMPAINLGQGITGSKMLAVRTITNGTSVLNGNLDDIGIWFRALTQQEITNLYNSTGCNATITPQTATTFCTGGSVTLGASAGSSYAWSGNQTTQNITVSQGGTYAVTVTDANACTASASVSVTVNALPTAAPTASPSTICNGNSTTLAANAAAGSGTISTYAWSSGIGGSLSGGSVSPTGNTTYTVTVTNSNSCSASGTVSVTVNAKPTVAPSATPSAFCIGGSTTLAANAAAGSGTISTYAWSSGIVGNLSGGSVSPTGNTTYTVTVTNSNSCSVSGSILVTVYPLPTVSFTLPAFINNNASTVTLNGSPNGGSYSGIGGLSGNTLNPSQAGLGSKLITYTYTNGNGCTNSASATTVVYDTTGIICTHYDTSTTYITVYDTTHVTVNDTTHVSVSTTDTLVIDVTLTGINPPNNTNAVTVYPNPAHDHLVVNNGNLSSMTGYSIKITNLLGQIVFNQPVNQQQFYIDLSAWGGNGTYILYVLDAQQTIKSTKEIVLQ